MRFRRRSRWGSWRRRWTRGQGGWNLWSRGSTMEEISIDRNCNFKQCWTERYFWIESKITLKYPHYRGTHGSWGRLWGCCRGERRRRHRQGLRQGSTRSLQSFRISFGRAWNCQLRSKYCVSWSLVPWWYFRICDSKTNKLLVEAAWIKTNLNICIILCTLLCFLSNIAGF